MLWINYNKNIKTIFINIQSNDILVAIIFPYWDVWKNLLLGDKKWHSYSWNYRFNSWLIWYRIFTARIQARIWELYFNCRCVGECSYRCWLLSRSCKSTRYSFPAHCQAPRPARDVRHWILTDWNQRPARIWIPRDHGWYCKRILLPWRSQNDHWRNDVGENQCRSSLLYFLGLTLAFLRRRQYPDVLWVLPKFSKLHCI